MALTKVTGQVIKNTTDVTVGVLTVTNTLAVGGTVSIGGTLTYEDVTNIDSVGLITARNGIVVGSGITLSKDGDIFATGVTTATSFVGDGSQLTGVASTENIRTNTNATFLQNINVSGTSTVGGAIFADADLFMVDSLRHTNDTDTKIRFPSADTIQLETAGSERLKITSAGVIQCGTSGVLKAEINNAVSGHQFISQCDDNNNGFEVYQKHGLTTTRNTFAVYANTGASSSKEAQLLVRGDGKVLIGTGVTISSDGIDAVGVAITCASINEGHIGGRRNYIINGAMRIAQRGTSTTASPSYGMDRWWKVDGGSATMAQDSTVPSGEGFSYSMKLSNISGDVSIGQPIELVPAGKQGGFPVGKRITFSFYAKCDSGTDGISVYAMFRQGKYDATNQVTFTGSGASVTLTTTWTRHVVTMTIPTCHSGSTMVAFEIGGITGTSYFTGFQAELGEVATPFEHRTLADDYRDCLRYYYESRVDGNNFSGTNPNNYASGFLGFGLNDQRISANVRFPVPMRGIPSVTMIRPSDGSAGDAHLFKGVTGSNGAGDVDFGSVSAVDIGSHGFLYWSCTTNVTQGAAYLFHIKADSEI